MNSFNVEALRQWWDLNVEVKDKPYWVLSRGYGDKQGPTISTYFHEDANNSYSALVQAINNAIGQGVTDFWIVLRPAGKNDTKGKLEYQVRATGWNAVQPQNGSVGSTGQNGYPMPAPMPHVDVDAKLEQLRAEHRLEIMQMKHERQLEVMEEKITGIAESQKSWLDQALELLDHPVIGQAIIRMLPANANAQAMAANIGHVPGAKPRPAPKVYEMPAEPDSEGETDHPDEAQGPPIYEELAGEYDCAIEAVNLLAEAHYEAPGELLQKVARWAVANPQMAKNLIGSL